MNLSIEKTNTITSIETWYNVAPPEGGANQWVDGRSAKEFAKYMLSESGKMPSAIADFIQSIGWKTLECICIPESVTEFPKSFGSGSGRHHDALLISNDWIIGVEAKVSESFDHRIQEWLEAGLKNSDNGTNRKNRICQSLKLITGRDYSANDLASDQILNLRYQLISATVGTIIEAKKRKLHNACLLVLEFGGKVRKERNYDGKIESNATDFDNYLDFLRISEKTDKERKIQVDESLTLWIKKIRINISSNDYAVIE